MCRGKKKSSSHPQVAAELVLGTIRHQKGRMSPLMHDLEKKLPVGARERAETLMKSLQTCRWTSSLQLPLSTYTSNWNQTESRRIEAAA